MPGGAYRGRGEAPELKVKTTLPGSWLEGPLERVVGLFCKQYNAKHPDLPLGHWADAKLRGLGGGIMR